MKEGRNPGGCGVGAADTFIGDDNNVMLAERLRAISRPSKDPHNLMFSDPSIKFTSEDEFHNRNSCVSFECSPGYYSDRSSTQASLNADSSSFAMSPWNQTSSPNDTSPWISNNNPFLTSITPPVAAAPAAADLFPPGTGLVASLVREEGHIYSLAAAGDLLYTGSDSKNIRVWKGQKEFSGFKSNSGLIKAIVISADHRIFTGHQDGKIRIWKASSKNPREHKHIVTLPRLKDFLKCSMNPSNYVESRRRHHVWIRHSDAVSCLALDEQNCLLYSGSWDRTLKVWRLYDSRCLESVKAHDDAINAVVVGFHGLVFTGSADGTVKVWRREPGGKRRASTVQTLLKQDNAVTALAVNTAAGVVYAGSSDGAVNLWKERGLAHAGVLAAHKIAVLCLATAGNFLFTGSADKTICIWGRDDGGAHACLSVLTGHDGPVKCLAVEEDGDGGAAGSCGDNRWVVYSGSLDKSVKVWKVWKVWDPVDQHQGRVAHCSITGPPIYDAY